MFRDAVHDLSKSNDLLVYTQTSKREGGALICRTTVMQSVPRAVATGSPPIARIEIARTVTRSLPLSVLTSSSNYSRHRHQPQARRHPGCNEKMIEEFAEGRHVRGQAAAEIHLDA